MKKTMGYTLLTSFNISFFITIFVIIGSPWWYGFIATAGVAVIVFLFVLIDWLLS